MWIILSHEAMDTGGGAIAPLQIFFFLLSCAPSLASCLVHFVPNVFFLAMFPAPRPHSILRKKIDYKALGTLVIQFIPRHPLKTLNGEFRF